ncbi:MAG: TPM domain-containing protein [Bacteroidetes bacterium]|nr:MAG: TPM domain-containing protein [Bacteroidota bacterium]
MFKHLRFVFLTLFFSLCFAQTIKAQFNIPEIPKEQTSVYDFVKLLSPTEKQSLEYKLIKYSDTTSTQIVVAIISTTKGENIGLLTPKWAQKWGIGQAKEDNGIFILLAKDDRKIWISPGYGVEHKLTAGIVGELTRTVIIPEFKRGDYYSGLDQGVDALFQVLMGEYQGARQSSDNDEVPFVFIILFIVVFIIILIAVTKNRRGGNSGNKGNKTKGFSLLDAIILSNMGRSSTSSRSRGFGGGGFSGGGFSGGFGGGGFSGGGAGGSW